MASPICSGGGPWDSNSPELQAGSSHKTPAWYTVDEQGLDLMELELAAGPGITATDRMFRRPVVVLGVGFGDAAGRLLLNTTVGVPLWASVSAILVPAATGMVFGIYPARKAARMDSIDALRLE